MEVKYYWQDFDIGSTAKLGTKMFSKESIISFGKQYDPQFFHVDEDRAPSSNFGGIIASGWQTCSEMMRIICDSYLLETASLGSPGIENLRWIKPIRPGDKVTLFRNIKSKRVSRSNPKVGIIDIHFEAKNQRAELVFSMEVCQMVATG